MNAEQLAELAHELHTQDNLYTADPMYLVQEEEIIYGFKSDYAEEYHWYFADDGEFFEVPEDGEGLPLGEDQAEEFGYTKVYFHRQWVFKCAHMTMKAAELYIETQRHNLKNPRVFVESMHRCPEMISIREHLMTLTACDRHGCRSVDGEDPDSGKFYMMDTRQFVGNNILFWKKPSGYTCHLDEAEVFTKEEAEDIYANRATDCPVPVAEMKAAASLQVDVQKVGKDYE